jgi:4-carboxymuconolactone decarboxylase
VEVPFAPLIPAALDDEQRALYESVLTSPRAEGARRAILVRDDGTLTGPFDAWMRSPRIGLLFERAGMALRTDALLSAGAREIAILVVAKAWRATFEWSVHAFVAQGAGVPNDVIEAIASGTTPVIDDPALAAAHAIAVELVSDHHLSTATRDRALVALGERGVVEVVMNVGFYQLVSATLESFPPPPGDPHTIEALQARAEKAQSK